MSTINIAGLTPVEDPSYRYKMPRLVGKVEGRGNGIKTVLVNVTDLGASLNRDPQEVTKFFGCELGAQTTYATDTDRAIVNGAHRDADLQDHLRKYIEHFVLCKNCRLPETHYKIKDGLISQKCLACGSKDRVDMHHKLTAFILAQHKKHKAEEKKSGGDKKDKKKKDKEKKKDASGDAADNGEPESKTDKKKSSAEKKSKKSNSGGSSPNPADAVGENVFGFSADADSDPAVEEDESDSKAADEGIVKFRIFLENCKEQGSTPSTAEILEQLRIIQTMQSLRPADRIIIYLGATFSETALADNLVEEHAEVLKALAGSVIQQRHLIAAMEWLCGSRHPDKLKRVFPLLLKQLFEEDLVEEDTFFAWAADLDRNDYSAHQSMIDLDTLEELKKAAAPFITWLQEAEEEDDDEDEEGEDEDEED